MINTETLEKLNDLGIGSDVDLLESKVFEMQDAAAEGNPIVADAVYDEYIRLLKDVKPESEALNRNWEKDEEPLSDDDEILKKIGMCSIQTITNYDELKWFKQVLNEIGRNVELMCSTKENGHAVRFVYRYGELVLASTRGRVSKGRNVLRHVKSAVKNYIEEFKDIPLVEIRGEAIVRKEDFLKVFKGKYKTPLSTVTGIMRDSVSDEELQYLHVVCYKIASNSNLLKFDKLSSEFEYLRKLGFETPEFATLEDVDSGNYEEAVEAFLQIFEQMVDSGRIVYDCDGIVVAINDTKTFYGVGKNGNSWRSNFAVKMGKHWECNIYDSVIKSIEWIPGKRFIVPKAVIEPVVTANGSTVRKVPLYNVGVMERYELFTGSTIFFRYGGETGVTLTDEFGNSVKK